jgi:hypothetical protein
VAIMVVQMAVMSIGMRVFRSDQAGKWLETKNFITFEPGARSKAS